MVEEESILDEAKRITDSERMIEYGHPKKSLSTIANYWIIYLDSKDDYTITSKDVSMMMILLKIARESNKSKRDNLVDISGYARLASIIEEIES